VNLGRSLPDQETAHEYSWLSRDLLERAPPAYFPLTAVPKRNRILTIDVTRVTLEPGYEHEVSNMATDEWALLVYRIPAQPSRLRLQIWRLLQRMGAVYLQNAACLLPARPDLVENMQYVAATIQEMGGTCHLFNARTLLPDGDSRIRDEFRDLVDGRLEEILV